MKRTLPFLLVLIAAIVLAVVLSIPAAGTETQRVTVRLADGTTQEVVVELPPGSSPEAARDLVSGEPIAIEPTEGDTNSEPTPPVNDQTGTPPVGNPQEVVPVQTPPAPQPKLPALPPTPALPAVPATTPTAPAPKAETGEGQKPSSDGRRVKTRKGKSQPKAEGRQDSGGTRANRPVAPIRNTDGSPTRSNPGFVDALPGPSRATGVPNFVIRKFRVPIFLLPIYQAAGIEYGIRWEILAAINEIETDYGRNLNVSSAGALGWMQFIPSTWAMYGTDGNKDGKKDPYNPVDAIFAAARYLKAAGYEQDVRRAIFAYNHADWYVDSVMLRARLISGVPADLVGSLTGLTEGRFPVFARARYADDLQEREALKQVREGQNAANVVESQDDRRSIDIFTRQGAPVVATNDGVIKKLGTSPKLGHYITLQDVYGNRYTYGQLGSVAKYYPVPKDDQDAAGGNHARAVRAHKDEAPKKPASAGKQAAPLGDEVKPGTDSARGSVPVKERLFAHPNLTQARDHGGLEQVLDAELQKKDGFTTYKNWFSRPYGLDSKDVRLRALRKGSRVIGGTILGRVGPAVGDKASHLNFAIRPAGRGAPRIDPKPILDGWKLLEATAIYRADGKNVLKKGERKFSIGQLLLMPKPMLERRVLADERIEVYAGGREDIRSGQIDRRVLGTLAYLAESGLRPTVSSLKSGHGYLTSSGNVSHHSSGNAVDIAAINGIPIIGHQEQNGVTEQAVRAIMRLQGTMRPSQIISLLDLGANTVAMGDHNDHIHVGFQPRFGDNRKLGLQAMAVLKPGQWSDLLDRLRQIENPVVPTKPSKYAIPVHKHSHASDAHSGE